MREMTPARALVQIALMAPAMAAVTSVIIAIEVTKILVAAVGGRS